MDKVDLTVAVEIDTVLEELRRHELGQANRTRPRRFHVRARHPCRQHPQTCDKLGTKHVLTLANIRLRRQHADRVVGQLIGAERRLAAPDRQQAISIDADLALYPFERHFMLGQQRAALACQARQRIGADVVLRRLGELGLSAFGNLLLAGDHEVGQRHVGSEACDSLVKNFARYARLLRLRPHAIQECRERLRSHRRSYTERHDHERNRCCSRAIPFCQSHSCISARRCSASLYLI